MDGFDELFSQLLRWCRGQGQPWRAGPDRFLVAVHPVTDGQGNLLTVFRRRQLRHVRFICQETALHQRRRAPHVGNDKELLRLGSAVHGVRPRDQRRLDEVGQTFALLRRGTDVGPLQKGQPREKAWRRGRLPERIIGLDPGGRRTRVVIEMNADEKRVVLVIA